MEISLFQSGKGDCLLLESASGKRILCDGGMAKSMRNHVREHLSQLDHIDVVYVSHIDQDHISGILQLLEDTLRWSVFDAHTDNDVNAPLRPRPPTIGTLWHNSFHDQITPNRGAIERLLAHSVPVFLGSEVPAMMNQGAEYQRISTSIKEALKVSRLAKADLLDIPLNQFPGQSSRAKLMMRRASQPSFELDDLKVTIVGPSKKSLIQLRKGWDNWLRKNRDIRQRIDKYVEDRLRQFNNGVDFNPFDLGSWNGVPDVKGVTPPNVESLVLMIEEGDIRILLTGDAQQDQLLKDLEASKFLVNDRLHLDVLKVQHHGSEHNTDRDFCRKVTADNYIFCGDGLNGNPEPDVIQMYFDARLGPEIFHSSDTSLADRPFTMWFSTTSAHQSGNRRTHMETVEALVNQLVAESGGLMDAHFNDGDVMGIEFI